MKKVALAVALCCSLGVGVASADIWKNIGKTIGKAWEDEQRDKKKQECMQKCVGMRDNNVLKKVCTDQCGWEL